MVVIDSYLPLQSVAITTKVYEPITVRGMLYSFKLVQKYKI